MREIACCFSLLVICSLLAVCSTFAETIYLDSANRSFNVISPRTWQRSQITTPNSKVKFISPPGTPEASCAVIVQKYEGLRNTSQAALNSIFLEPPNSKEIASHLSLQYNNVRVLSIGARMLSGSPSYYYNTQYSTGTPEGRLWIRSATNTTATTPGLVWVVSCGTTGKSIAEADAGFSYWQFEITKFITNFEIR